LDFGKSLYRQKHFLKGLARLSHSHLLRLPIVNFWFHPIYGVYHTVTVCAALSIAAVVEAKVRLVAVRVKAGAVVKSYFKSGNTKEAVSTEEKALSSTQNVQDRQTLQRHLAEFTAAQNSRVKHYGSP